MSRNNQGELSKRSAGALKQRRVPLPWPEKRDFRILSIDGGGIRGIFPAAVLAGLEKRYLNGSSVAQYFDLIIGTSTGGIISIGLGAGMRAVELRDLYIERGNQIFPPGHSSVFEVVKRRWANVRWYFKYRYDREALMRVLDETFGEQKFGKSQSRLCVPSFDGRYGEVYIFKTPHHPDFQKDAEESMTKVAAATAAAPTFFQPLEDGGYVFVDGGVWANNPIMIGLVDTLSCFSVSRESIRIMSLGCGDDSYTFDEPQMLRGGKWAWRHIVHTAMRLQSANALGQASLLIGADRIVRINPPATKQKIELDDWTNAVFVLPGAADAAIDELSQTIMSDFFQKPVIPYFPILKNH